MRWEPSSLAPKDGIPAWNPALGSPTLALQDQDAVGGTAGSSHGAASRAGTLPLREMCYFCLHITIYALLTENNT